MNAMDTSVDPCDDFFMYSCGGWLKKNLVPEDKSSYSTFTKLRDELLANLKGKHTFSDYECLAGILKSAEI